MLALSSCGKNDQTPVKLGPVSLTGSVSATGVSLSRRGSHVLSIDGQALYYLESKTENLQSAEGKLAHIEGVSQANIHADQLPVIVVKKLSTSSVQTRQVTIPEFGIVLEVPVSWDAVSEPGLTRFFLGKETKPMVIAVRGMQLPADGHLLYIDGSKAMDTPLGDGVAMEEKVSILTDHGTIDFTFRPTGGGFKDEATRLKLREQFLQMVHSLHFGQSSSSLTSSIGASSSSVGNGSETLCGGTAGVVCPQGYYCNVYDPETNVGRCKKR